MANGRTSVPARRRLFALALVYQVVGLAILAASAYLVWDRPDSMIFWVPVPVWQWSLLGAIAGVLYRIALLHGTEAGADERLYMWAIVKPFVGTALGGVIYFLTAAGMLALTPGAKIQNIQLLCAVSFLAAFSDRFSGQLLNRVMSSIVARTGSGRRAMERAAP